MIPVLNLWLPRQVVEDIRLGTPAEDRRMWSTGPWWAAWLVGVIVGDIAALVAGKS